jgi:hypothetical protein
MDSRLLLRISDKQKAKEFLLKRSTEITHFSLYLLVMRLVYLTVMISNYLKGDATQSRVIFHGLGDAIHLITILICWKFPLKV